MDEEKKVDATPAEITEETEVTEETISPAESIEEATKEEVA